MTLNSKYIQCTDVERKAEKEIFRYRRSKQAYDHLLGSGLSKDTDVRTSFHLLRSKKLIFLVLTFKYYLKYKAQSEAKSLVSGLSFTKNRALFPTEIPKVEKHQKVTSEWRDPVNTITTPNQ